MFIRSVLEYAVFAIRHDSNVSPDMRDRTILTWEKAIGTAKAWMLGVNSKCNRKLVNFESDFIPLITRVELLDFSYLRSIVEKVQRFAHKSKLEKLLSWPYSEDEINKSARLYLLYRRKLEMMKKQIKDGLKPSTFIPDYTFTRYLSDSKKKEWRTTRYHAILSDDNLESSRFYRTFCIKDTREAVRTKLIHRNNKYITQARLGLKSEEQQEKN